MESTVTTTPTPTPIPAPQGGDPDGSFGPSRASRGHIGRIVAGSLVVGLVTAFLLAAAPFIRPEEDDVTGAVLCGFAIGWATLALLSARFTDQPQRWAAIPAVFLGVSGLLLIAFGT